jgi:hypothetical protein
LKPTLKYNDSMKNALSTMLKKWLSPSMRFKFRAHAAWLNELRKRMCLWRWELVKLSHQGNSSHNIVYIGRKDKRSQALALLGLKNEVNKLNGNLPFHQVLVSEAPLPGALRVPQTLNTVLPLGRPITEIVAGYSSSLRTLIHSHRASYSIKSVQDDADIDRIDREMLKPYATARHNGSAVHLQKETVHKLAKSEFGRLTEVFLGDEAVACQLSCTFERDGKRYWSSNRFGYTAAVFSDHKRRGEVSAINCYLALEWALENGFDYHDYGASLGRPDDGMLQWKRHRRGTLETLDTSGYFYVKLPKTGAEQFLWDSPLFSVKRGHLSLHLGVPSDKSEDDILMRYREMGFGGISKVLLYHTQPLDDALVEKFSGLYQQQKPAPIIKCILA